MTLTLRLAELPDRCRTLARSHVANHVDAASVMLDKFHNSPKTGSVDFGDEEQALELGWERPTPLVRATHEIELHATEDGAYAVAIGVAISCGYLIRRRAHHGSGSDYLLTREGGSANELIKLEVSGVARPRDRGRLRARVKQKLAQLARGDLRGPGVAVVVGFESARVLMRNTEEGAP
ncbi:MAG: hypothetical protein R6X02_09630 [Enhygromyxa sp.]